METAGCCFPLDALFTQKNQAALRQRIQKNQPQTTNTATGLGNLSHPATRDGAKRAPGASLCLMPRFLVWLRGISQKRLLWQKN